MTDSQAVQKLREQIAATERRLRGTFGIAWKDLDTGDTFLYNAQEVMHAASLMKVPVMIEVFRQAEQGRFRLGDSLLLRNSFRSIVDGSTYSLRATAESDSSVYAHLGGKMTIRDLVHHMITVSSNLAANLLLELVGPENVTATVRTLGASHTQVRRGLEDLKAHQKGINNETSAFDMMLLLEAIATGRAASKPACEQMMEIMFQQRLRTKIPALLPDSLKVAHKTGSISRIDHDAGIVVSPSGRRCVLVIMSRGISDHKRAAQGIATLSRALLQTMQFI
ncbi:MAG: serine hydrolase [Calditrichaeota bacterium]|nr:serine hydrolase [Calditrichota bacterium]